MKINVVSHGVKHIFKKETRVQCLECDFISNIASDTWLAIKMLKKKSGRVYGVRYECPRCLCVFDCLESET